MKLDKFIKEKFIYKKNQNIIKSLYFLFQKYLKNRPKLSYSGGGVDLLANYFFRNQKKGIYLDVGCYHPINGSNTYLLHKRGWSGINIDLDDGSIDLFNHFRKDDYNKRIAVSDYKGKINLYSYHNRSAVQTVSHENAKKMDQHGLRKIEIECDTLNSIIQESKFKNKEIDFLSIDIEGHELEALKTFDFNKYDPKLVIIEYNDPELVSIEFHYQKIDNIMKSEIYKFMYEKNYKFVNWHHCDLVFISETIFKKRKVGI
tara:strand:- start:830 stop:1606 length:777 start_codon:yes stop_codon:yes gene_type:complete